MNIKDKIGSSLEQLWGRALDAKVMHDEEMTDEPVAVAEAAYIKYRTNALNLAKQELLALLDAFADEVIGKDDAYNEMCEYCSSWDDGRNDLRVEQRSRKDRMLGKE